MNLNDKNINNYINSNYIGNRIHQLRSEHSLTLTQVSKAINGSAGFLSDVEKGKSLPSISKLIELCNYFNITLSDFFDDGSNAVILTDETRKLVEASKDLSPEQLDLLSKFLKTLK